jgi:ATP-dependent exoDNAse (exonuclease V) beta subunit
MNMYMNVGSCLCLKSSIQLTTLACAGTGKTFIGVAVARALLANNGLRLLVVTYTNHAVTP